MTKTIGYWKRIKSEKSDLPWPIENSFTLSEEEKEVFLKELKRKESKSGITRYRGISLCRICEQTNGNAEYSLDDWCWPSGYMHYIQEHDVQPDEEFYKWIMDN